MAAENAIGGVLPLHLSFIGPLDETMSTFRLDSGLTAAAVLKKTALRGFGLSRLSFAGRDLVLLELAQ